MRLLKIILIVLLLLAILGFVGTNLDTVVDLTVVSTVYHDFPLYALVIAALAYFTGQGGKLTKATPPKTEKES